MKRFVWVAGSLLAVALAIYIGLNFGASRTPDAQPPLATIASAGDLARAFNEHADEVRVLVMLSPT